LKRKIRWTKNFCRHWQHS